ncbi:OmpH family outer membrane protein [bacterium]|nr:OmpH family outer membrane protein [bacterium]MBU1614827.1 OmpH family outer membrane protein [bacterium]
MFRRFFLVLLLFFALLATPALTEGIKIAFVDATKIFDEFPETEKATQALNEEVKVKREKIDQLQSEIERMQEKLATNPLLREEERKKQQEAIERKKQELARVAEEARQSLGEKEQALTKRIIDKITKTIEAIAKEKGIDLVVEKNSIVYGNERLDITKEVIERLKK